MLLRPIYRQIAEIQNAEIFSTNTLLVILGTSLLTAMAGLSMALGAFLAGLLLAETEFSLQVESDICHLFNIHSGLRRIGRVFTQRRILTSFVVRHLIISRDLCNHRRPTEWLSSLSLLLLFVKFSSTVILVKQLFYVLDCGWCNEWMVLIGVRCRC